MIRRLIFALATIAILIPIAISLHLIDKGPEAAHPLEWDEMNVWSLAD